MVLNFKKPYYKTCFENAEFVSFISDTFVG
jgi:hypothetical protein